MTLVVAGNQSFFRAPGLSLCRYRKVITWVPVLKNLLSNWKVY
jgi:hypothetical protein